MSFIGKVVWITGASSGIGEALAREFSKSGAKLILSARRQDELERVKASLGRAAEDILVLPLDLADHSSFAVKTAEALAAFSQIDVLINNGGVSQRALASETDLAVDKQIMDVNYFGTVGLTKAALPSMLARKSGHIVAISSLAGKFGTPLRSTYSASKHALHGFFESLRAEVWQDGVSVTLICPGYISTQVSVNALTGDGRKFKKMDRAVAAGMAPELCARQIVRAIAKNREEVFVGTTREKMLVWLKYLAPQQFAKMIRKAAPK